MTVRERPICDCPEQPCVCYAQGQAAGREQALFDFISRADGHAQDCGCDPCQFKQAWGLKEQDNRN